MERTAARLLRLLHDVAVAAMQAEDAEHALRAAVVEVCRSTGWPVGHVYAREDGELVPTGIWHFAVEDPERFASLVRVSETRRFEEGSGLPGRVLATGAPAWVADVASDPNFPRGAAALSAGVRAAVAFPVLVRGSVAAVFEFFATEPTEPDARLLEAMATIGLSLGQVFEHRRGQDAVRESEARLRALAETASDAIVTIDVDDRILFANSSAARLFEVDPARFRSMHFSELMPERFRARHRAGLKRFVATGERHMRWDGVELPGLRADGVEIPLEISFGTFERGGVTFFTGIMRDISERRRAEEERAQILERERLARSSAESARAEAERRARQESALREAAAAVAAAFTVHETTQRIAGSALVATRADGAYVERIEVTTDEVVVVAVAGTLVPAVGSRVPYAGSVTRRVVEREEAQVIARLGQDGTGLPGGLEDRCAGCSAAVIPLLNAGEPVGSLVLLRAAGSDPFRDDELERAFTFGDLAGLAFRKIHLLEDSERKRAELERVMESRTRLIHGFSHDVKNPIGAADGFLALIEEGEVYGGVPEKPLEAVRNARRSLGSAIRLIDDLLELARAESGLIEIRSAALDAREAAREVVAEHRAQAERAKLSLDLDVPAELPVVESDPARVRQIIGNLLSNAIKYTPGPGSVCVRVFQLNGIVGVSVRDTGPGIPEDKREFLFEEFARLQPDMPGGAGIGLSISRRIARALGGDLTLESELGEGSTFTLELPLERGGRGA